MIWGSTNFGNLYIDVKSKLTEELHERMHNEISMLVNDDDVNKRWWENATYSYTVEKVANDCQSEQG